MRNSMLIIATVCGSTAAFSVSQALAAESAPIYTQTEAEVIGTCETGEFSSHRISSAEESARSQEEAKEESKPDVRQPLITDEMKARADIDGDGEITTLDLMLLLAGWGNCPAWSELSCAGDINDDFVVDYADLSIMLTLLNLSAVPTNVEIEVPDAQIEVQVGQE